MFDCFSTDFECLDGTERMIKKYLKGADAIVLVYDVTDCVSFGEMPVLIQEVEKKAESGAIKVAVGCCIDNTDGRMISKANAEELFSKHQIPCYEVSARTGEGICEVFRGIAETYLSSRAK